MQSATDISEPPPRPREADSRWRLAQMVVAGPQFARSPLLSRFLLYVVGETIEGRQSNLTEHRIGVAVFGRPASYRTDQDNIVRNYARQLRKRLTEHFAADGSGAAMRIEIPIGGYVPVFHEVVEQRAVVPQPVSNPRRRGIGRWPLGLRIALGIVAVMLLAAAGIVRHGWRASASSVQVVSDFWNVVLPHGSTTYVIPADAGFNLMEDMSKRALPLATYIHGSYDDVPWGTVVGHAQQDLRTQEYTDFVSLQIVASLARLPEYDPQRVLLRFPRDLRIDDLKHANALIIGSASANPWASIDFGANFHIELSHDMESAVIVNVHPEKGEQRTYASHWNEPAHETFALIQFLPNLSGSGHMLLVQGLDVAGTEAAAELLFHGDSIAPILRRARRTDGTFRSFEVLVRATSIQSNAEDAQVLASRILEG